MMIDFEFIETLEGGCRVTGYVPAADWSRSGVTIATGFDLGCRDERDLIAMGFSKNLIDKLKPYLGLRNYDAQNLLMRKLLVITQAEAHFINSCVKSNAITLLIDSYPDFEALSDECQTVIASVAFQYGNLEKRCPKFWKFCIAKDWKNVIIELNNFGDRYPTRRKKESKLLKRWLDGNTQKIKS